MLLHPSNFLLLDEPTNHLDLRAKDVLLESLQKFTGTCVFVSHDRYFIDRLATRVFEVADGAVNIFPGNYEDYLWRKQNGAQELEQSLRSSIAAPAPVAPAEIVEPSAEPKKRVNPMKRKQMAARLEKVESEVSRTESVIAESEESLSRYVSAEKPRESPPYWKKSVAPFKPWKPSGPNSAKNWKSSSSTAWPSQGRHGRVPNRGQFMPHVFRRTRDYSAIQI